MSKDRNSTPGIMKLLLGTACSILPIALVAGCATQPSTPLAVAYQELPKPHPVGGPCLFTDMPGVFQVTGIKLAPSGGLTVVYYEFFFGPMDKAATQNAGHSIHNLYEVVASDVPSIGQRFAGINSMETQGTCPSEFFSYKKDNVTHSLHKDHSLPD